MEVVQLVVLVMFGSVIALIGGFAFLFIKPLHTWLSRYSTPFAAGVLLTVSLVGLLPESVDIVGEGAFLIALTSFLLAFLFETFLFGIHHHDHSEHESNFRGTVSLVVIGDTIHNFIDGTAIAAAFFAAPGLGLVIAISTFLHEVPHEIGDFGILLKAGWKKRSILLVNIVSSLVSLVGAFFVLYLSPSKELLGSLLAVAAGIFLYLGASDFLPDLREDREDKIRPVIVLIIGVLMMFITLNIIPHSH